MAELIVSMDLKSPIPLPLKSLRGQHYDINATILWSKINATYFTQDSRAACKTTIMLARNDPSHLPDKSS